MRFRSQAIRRGESGEMKLGCVLWTVALALAVLVAWKMVPVKIKSAQLYDFMVEEAKYASSVKPEALKKGILRKAQELDLPVSEKRVKVVTTGSRIRMSVSYMVPVHFPGYTYEWHFNHEVDRPIFMF